jgi:hypothetical protein
MNDAPNNALQRTGRELFPAFDALDALTAPSLGLGAFGHIRASRL